MLVKMSHEPISALPNMYEYTGTHGINHIRVISAPASLQNARSCRHISIGRDSAISFIHKSQCGALSRFFFYWNAIFSTIWCRWARLNTGWLAQLSRCPAPAVSDFLAASRSSTGDVERGYWSFSSTFKTPKPMS